MSRFVAVAGTWGYDGAPSEDEWYHPKSAWSDFMRAHGFLHANSRCPFVWDGAIDGIPNWLVRWSSPRQHLVWKAAGANLAFYLKTLRPQDRNVIAHSHGGQVALYAALQMGREPFGKLITVSMPIRADMLGVSRQALPTLAGWWHFYAKGWSDRMQILGDLFDGACGINRQVSLPGVQNVGIPNGVGHSGLLERPDEFVWWINSGALDWLAGHGRT